MNAADDHPYCKDCGYSLMGLTESSKCPECGKPIVEVLVRNSFPGSKGIRYQSPYTVLGLPLICVAIGPHGTEKFGRAVGFIAIGDRARGVIALGGIAQGGLAIGGLAVGVVAFGGCSLGGLAIGGSNLGIVAIGGLAIGGWSFGGVAAAVVRGWGGVVYRLWPW